MSSWRLVRYWTSRDTLGYRCFLYTETNAPVQQLVSDSAVAGGA